MKNWKVSLKKTGKIIVLFLLIFVPNNILHATENNFITEKTREINNISEGWEVTEYENILNQPVELFFIQGRNRLGTDIYMAELGGSNIGRGFFTAKKEITLKAGETYKIKLRYLSLIHYHDKTPSGTSGYVDFNGVRYDAAVYEGTESPEINDEGNFEQFHEEVITPNQDMIYAITIHYEIGRNSYPQVALMVGADMSTEGFLETYNVEYNANGATGTAPIDTKKYVKNEEAIIQDKQNLTSAGKVFNHWNTKADGTGESYNIGEKLIVDEAKVLYAQFNEVKEEETTGNNDVDVDYRFVAKDVSISIADFTEKRENSSLADYIIEQSEAKVYQYPENKEDGPVQVDTSIFNNVEVKANEQYDVEVYYDTSNNQAKTSQTRVDGNQTQPVLENRSTDIVSSKITLTIVDDNLKLPATGEAIGTTVFIGLIVSLTSFSILILLKNKNKNIF